ncbi:MAG: TolC family protein [Gemmatimonadaceae bacterium]|nr:TolC family protein [Gemmatimonadaceae bacterium]
MHIKPPSVSRLVVLAAMVARPASASAQLALADALREADRHNVANRVATATVAADRARALGALAGVLPTARIEVGALRTTDPIGAFGTSLRQRTITATDFDPPRLNFPAPISNVGTALVGELPLVNADAWAGRRAARGAVEAGDAAREWTRVGTRVEVIRAYFGAVLATERVTTLSASVRAAQAHLRQAQAMTREGVVTRADALLAAVRAGDLDALLAEARAAADDARRQLLVSIGREVRADPEVQLPLPAALPDGDAIRRVVAPDTGDVPMAWSSRPDVRAASAGRRAARADARRTQGALLPRVNAFARYEWNTPSALFAGRSNWTVGVMGSLPLVHSATAWGDAQGASARARAADAGADGALARARLEDAATRSALRVALERLTIAEQGAAQGTEAQRIVEKRYAAGLASIAELLDAQAAATATALAWSHARYAVIAAAAERRRAIGGDPGTLVALDHAPLSTTSPSEPTTHVTDR